MTERDALLAHIEHTVGPIDQIWSGADETELVHVGPDADRPFQFVATLGMSAHRMNAPREDWEFAELCLLLPVEWDLDEKWPLEWLQTLANLPKRNDSWLGYGHTIPNGDPPRRFSRQTELAAWLLLPPVSLPPEFAAVWLSREKLVRFWGLVGIHADEMAFKLQNTTPRLLAIFQNSEVSDILDLNRPSALVERGVKRWIMGT